MIIIKYPNLTGGSKSFDTHVTEYHLGALVATFLIGQWAKNTNIWPKKPIWAKFDRFWAKNPNFYGSKQKFWYPHNGKTT